MIIVDYLGRLGNQMFQYALGRHLAEEMGYELFAAPLPFPATRDCVKGRAFRDPVHHIGLFHADIPAILADKRDRAILLHGFFQRYTYYAPFFERIRRWFAYPDDLRREVSANPDDLLVYVRLGDYADVAMHLSFGFYETAIKMSKARSVTVVTEDKNHPFLHHFAPYDANIVSGDLLADLALARSYKKVVISCSTFAWWAAMLADPEEIYFPVADDGLWSPERLHYPGFQHDLRIDDPRFVYFYNCSIASSNRNTSTYVPLHNAPTQPPNIDAFVLDSVAFHKISKAYWFT